MKVVLEKRRGEPVSLMETKARIENRKIVPYISAAVGVDTMEILSV